MKNWPPILPKNFPLTVTDRGYVKRIAGRVRWIVGRVAPKEALKVYHRKAAVLLAGVRPLKAVAPVTGAVTLHYILGRWIIDRRADAERGELTAGAFAQYRTSAMRIDAIAGHHLASDVTPDLTRWIYDRLSAEFTIDSAKRALAHLRSACRYAEEQHWCPAVSLGQETLARLIAKPRASMKWRLFTPKEIRRILDAAENDVRESDGRGRATAIQMRAMILMALNGGYGAKELSDLPRSVVDLDSACIDYRRGKTGKDHVVPLWPETVAALRPALDLRPHDELLFRTREGHAWSRKMPKYREGKIVGGVSNDNVNYRFTMILKRLGLKISGQGFYKLKHTANTCADEFHDVHATFTLFGHGLPGTKAHYVRVSIDRVRNLSEFMRLHLIVPTRTDSPATEPAS